MAAFPSVDLTKFDLVPAVKTLRKSGNFAVSTAGDVVKEAAYATVGIGILTVQRIQVRRREIERDLRR